MRFWKGLDSKMCSKDRNHPWVIGKWEKVNGPVEVDKNGFHAAWNTIDAMRIPNLGFLSEVEVRGKHDEREICILLTPNSIESSANDEAAWSELRVIHTWEWTKEDSVALAVFAAERVLDIFKKAFPHDKRPYKAIMAAKTWLMNPTEKNRKEAGRAVEAAEEASRIDSEELRGEYEAVLAAKEAARAAQCINEAHLHALHAVEAAELAVSKFFAVKKGPYEAWKKKREIKKECHKFILERLNMKVKR